MAVLFRDRSRVVAAARWLVPSVFAACAGALAAGMVEAWGAWSDSGALGAGATTGFLALLGLPALFVASVVARGLWAGWRPRHVAAVVVEDGGGAPALAGWVLVVALGTLALAWITFQGIWLLANHTAFKALPVSLAEPMVVVAGLLAVIAVGRPVVPVATAVLRGLDVRWRRWRVASRTVSVVIGAVLFGGGGLAMVALDHPGAAVCAVVIACGAGIVARSVVRWHATPASLLTPVRIAVGLLAIAAIVIELLWWLMIKPKIGPFDTGLFDAPLVGGAVWAVAQIGWPLVADRPVTRAARVAAAGFAVAAAAGAIGCALFAWQARPNLTLAIWGDRPLAGLAIDELFDLDDIRANISLAAFQPTARPGAVHPDIVLVTIDTVRADHTPPYNATGAADMPVLRQLAKVGTVFDWAFSPSNVTRRSIPSMVIGLQPNRVRGRVVGWALRVDPRHVLLAERMKAAGYDTAGFMCCEGFWGKEFHTGLERGLEHLEIEEVGHELARRAKVWLEARDRDPNRKPLFVWMHLIEPHRWTSQSGEGRNDEEKKRYYDRSLSLSDAALGELLSAFSNRPPALAPIVIVTADHGEALGEHGHPFHSTDLYDAQTHVPLVIAGPGIRPGLRVPESVSLVDLVPTIVELGGFEPPSGNTIDGYSIAGLATGARVSNDKGIAFAAMIKDRSNPGGITMVVKGKWKLISNEGGSYELYDTRTDPDEKFNIQNGRPGVLLDMHKLLDERNALGDVSPFE